MSKYSAYGTVNSFSDINIPYGSCLIPSNSKNRNSPNSEVFGNGTDYSECISNLIKQPSFIAQQNNQNVNKLDKSFFNNDQKPLGYSSGSMVTDTTLQSIRPEQPYSNYYINLASQTLHVKPDTLFSVFFSDDNVNHLRNKVVEKVKEITADSGNEVNIQTPTMDDFFYYMVNIYQNYKIHNGSICFINLKNKDDIKSELSKLNTNILQEYVSKMISQINMYIYYYKDASQLPEQLSLPTYNAMKGSKTLEYNNGFSSGNSIGVASYNQATNII